MLLEQARRTEDSSTSLREGNFAPLCVGRRKDGIYQIKWTSFPKKNNSTNVQKRCIAPKRMHFHRLNFLHQTGHKLVTETIIKNLMLDTVYLLFNSSITFPKLILLYFLVEATQQQRPAPTIRKLQMLQVLISPLVNLPAST